VSVFEEVAALLAIASVVGLEAVDRILAAGITPPLAAPASAA
jgi:hypothetical protein